jgi:hypothetical protein
MKTPQPGDLVILSINNLLTYGLTVQYTPEIFRYIWLGRTTDNPANWISSRLTHDKIYTDHIAGEYVPYRVFKIEDNQVSPEHLALANKFREKFKTILSK